MKKWYTIDVRNLKRLKLATAETYLNALHTDLNAYDGNSLFFNEINKTFINYLNAFLISNDESVIKSTKRLFSRNIYYKNHPFYPLIIKILEGNPLTKAKLKQLKEATNKHKNYPLAPLLNAVITPIKSGINPNDLLTLYYLNCVLREKNSDRESLDLLSASGFARPTLLLLQISNDLTEIKTLIRRLELKSLWTRPLLIKTLENEAITRGTSDKLYEALLKESENLGSKTANLLLANYYAEKISKNKDYVDFLIYHLTKAHLLKNKEATVRLITLYKDGRYVPKNSLMVRELQATLKD